MQKLHNLVMDSTLTWVLVAVAVVALVAVAWHQESNRLERRLARLGNLKGLTYTRIVHELGDPTVETRTSETGRSCKWVAPGYSIVLHFNGRFCQGASDETRWTVPGRSLNDLR